MKYLRSSVFCFIFGIILFYSLTCVTYAAEVSFKVVPNPVRNDTATVIEVMFDTEGESLNVVDGVLQISGDGVNNISSIVIETGDSGLSLWPVLPKYSTKDHTIRFTGGTPGIIPSDSLLFRLRVFTREAVPVTVSWLSGAAYRSDGKGGLSGVFARSLTVQLARSEPNQINPSSPDSVPPEFQGVELTQDQDTFEGKYFLSFQADDDISGISKYEVIENKKVTEVYNGIYVLENQDRSHEILIIAYDHAGNQTSIKIPAKQGWYVSITVWVVLMSSLLSFILYIVWRNTWKRHKPR